MVSDRKKEERILRKKLIIDSALSVFNRSGIDKTTMSLNVLYCSFAVNII